MDDSLVVRRFQRLGDLRRDGKGFFERNRALPDSIGQRRPLNQLHDQRPNPISLLKAVDGRDVGMIQCSESLRLTVESCEPIGILRKGVRKDFDCDLATKVYIGGAPHLTHAAHANLGGDFIRAEADANSESHGKWLRL